MIEDFVNKLLIGNAKDLCPQLPEKVFDCVITSVPYYGLRNYDNLPGQFGLEETPEEYVNNMVETFNGVKRNLKDDGTLWLNVGDCYWGGKGASGQETKESLERRAAAGKSMNKAHHNIIVRTRPTDRKHPIIKRKDKVGIPWALALALRDNGADVRTCKAINLAVKRIVSAYDSPGVIPDRVLYVLTDLQNEYAEAKGEGWYLRQDNIWFKKNCMPESCNDRPTTTHEYFFLFSKSIKYYYDFEAVKELSSENTHERISKEKLAAVNNGYNGNVLHNKKVGDYEEPIRNKNNSEFNKNMLRKFEKRHKRSVWSFSTNSPERNSIGSDHAAGYPEDLIVDPIKAGSREGGIVFDPFAGTGTTGIVSEKLHRKWTLIDLNPKSVKDFDIYRHQQFGVFK